MFDLDHVPFVGTRHFTPASGRKIDLVVIHDMEAPEAGNTAESVANYFRTTDREVSAHYCIDDNSVVQCVKLEDVAWHAPGSNNNGIGLEHAGYARQTAAEWLDLYGVAMLELSAKLTAALCARFGIPATFLDAPHLLASSRPRGITTHAQVTQAYHRSTHWDPGPNFPLSWYVAHVQAELGGKPAPIPPPAPRPGPPTTTPERLLRLASPYMRGADVHECQEKLLGWAWITRDNVLNPGAADSVFGPRTSSAVRDFQGRARIAVDGVVGPQTWGSLRRI